MKIISKKFYPLPEPRKNAQFARPSGFILRHFGYFGGRTKLNLAVVGELINFGA